METAGFLHAVKTVSQFVAVSVHRQAALLLKRYVKRGLALAGFKFNLDFIRVLCTHLDVDEFCQEVEVVFGNLFFAKLQFEIMVVLHHLSHAGGFVNV